jgi:hypothetical protein
MDLDAITNEVADQADEILSGISDRKDARTTLSEHIQANHSEMPPDDRLIVVRGIMAILDKEDFFGTDSTRTESVWGEGSDDVNEAKI